jgi:hypothetical protein
MLNQTSVKTVSATSRKIILIAEDRAVALPCIVSNSDVDVDANGKKIIKAGTPVTGSLSNRSVAFTVSTESPVGIILHDVDVTEGNANSQILIFGFVDESKLDADVKEKITEDVKSALKMISFVQ